MIGDRLEAFGGSKIDGRYRLRPTSFLPSGFETVDHEAADNPTYSRKSPRSSNPLKSEFNTEKNAGQGDNE